MNHIVNDELDELIHDSYMNSSVNESPSELL